MDQKNSRNRRRSFKRRRLEMGKYLWLSGIVVAVLMLQNVAMIESVPMDSGLMRIYKLAAVRSPPLHLWHHRAIRDATIAGGIMSSDAAGSQSSSTETIADQQPQGQCLLDGEYVPETTVFCEKQVGCRAIQKTGHCCPDYKCDCQKDGKTYLNGDKLVDPETPCTVCYCQGGEILCSSVTCFHRDDCTPKYIPGVCCPEYDNCPVVSPESTNTNKNLSSSTSTTIKPEMPLENDNKPKITIKEITKPTEIRITDDNKAIPIHQMLKPVLTATTTSTSTSTTTTTSSTSTSTSTTTTTPTPPFAPMESTTMLAATMNPSMTNNNNNAPEESIKLFHSHETLSEETFSTDNNHTNQKGENKMGINSNGNSGDILKLTASVAYPPVVPNVDTLATTSAPLSDSSVEVEDPVPALNAFSTQGLPEDPSKVNIKREYFITTEGVHAAAQQQYDGSGEYPASELIFGGGSASSAGQQQSLHGFQQSSAELDSDTAGSDNIYHIILTTDGPRMSTTSENYLALKGSSVSTEGSPFEDLSPLGSSPSLDSENNNISPSFTTEGPEMPSSSTAPPQREDIYTKSTTESPIMVVHQHLDEEDSEIPLESNPAYPSLPGEDFSIRGDNNYQMSDNDEVAIEEPRSIGGGVAARPNYDAFKSTKHLEDPLYGNESGSGGSSIEMGSGAGSGSGGMMVEELIGLATAATTEGSGGNMDLNSKTAKYEMRNKNNPEFLQFMYSAEDSSEETKITNSSDFQMENENNEKKKIEVISSLESTEQLYNTPMDILMSAELGSGAGSAVMKPKKEREPTTPKPRRVTSSGDIDELSNEASGNGPVDDPKEDAESLKLDDNISDVGGPNSDLSSKGNVLSVKVKTAQQEKAFDESSSSV